jgi:hypothetical protein
VGKFSLENDSFKKDFVLEFSCENPEIIFPHSTKKRVVVANLGSIHVFLRGADEVTINFSGVHVLIELQLAVGGSLEHVCFVFNSFFFLVFFCRNFLT